MKEPYFDPHNYDLTDDRLAYIVTKMFSDLGFSTAFRVPAPKLLSYVLTVRKNYRPVSYHNFTHAVSVVHGVYLLFKRGLLDKFGLDQIDAFGMFIASLNHDIDHRGTNNQFQKTASTALASFYSTSIMERHHFNQLSVDFDGKFFSPLIPS